MPDVQCPFCEIASEDPDGRVIEQNEYAILIEDGFPVTIGHSLIIPKRHTASFFEATTEERAAIYQLLENAKILIDQNISPVPTILALTMAPPQARLSPTSTFT